MSAMSRLNEVLFKYYSGFPLTIADAGVLPGVILGTDWLPSIPWDSNPHFREIDGFAWDIPPGTSGLRAEDFPTKLRDARALPFDVEESVSLAAELPLAQLGLTVGGSISRDWKVSVTVTKMKTRRFTDGFADEDLVDHLLKLKRSDRKWWQRVKSGFLVSSCWYCADAVIEFGDAGKVTAKAALENVLKGSASVSVDWDNDYMVKISGTPDIPYAVRGHRI